MGLIKWNDGQKGVAGQREVLGDPGTAVSVAVFLPDGVVALVMVLVSTLQCPQTVCLGGPSRWAAGLR